MHLKGFTQIAVNLSNFHTVHSQIASYGMFCLVVPLAIQLLKQSVSWHIRLTVVSNFNKINMSVSLSLEAVALTVNVSYLQMTF